MIFGYIKLCIAALLPVLTAAVVYISNINGILKIENVVTKRIFYGVIFGILAIVGTEWGIKISGAQVNCRDAAVLIAGFMFDPWSGIIAGFIGGIERWIAVAWGVGRFTRVACSVSTIISGFYAAVLRVYLFDNKRPRWMIAFATGVVMEVFHLTMVFVTNMNSPEEAIAVVRACSVPMIVANGLSVMFAGLTVDSLSKNIFDHENDKAKLSQIVQRRLLLATVLVFAATSVFIFRIQNKLTQNQTDSLLRRELNGVSEYIRDLDRSEIGRAVINQGVGDDGFFVIIDKNMNFVASSYDGNKDLILKEMPKIVGHNEHEKIRMSIMGEECFCMYQVSGNLYVIAAVTVQSVISSMVTVMYVNTFMEILVFALLFGLVYLLIKRTVVDNIKTITDVLSEIEQGNLDQTVDIYTSNEFTSLSNDINSTVGALKKLITDASARLDKELEMAKNIQESALPRIFPAFPKRHEFDIYASMATAKEVGGDFYDMYMLHDDTLHFLIADVSGKGIPAAMFMMRAKTELKTMTETDIPLSDVFTNGNAALCEGNDAGMFVTAWQGSLNLESGLVQFVNAGHNPPLVKHVNGKFEYISERPGFVLAGMDGVKYKTQTLQLQPGDIIYLYTDGITEATDANNELYGEERLKNALNAMEFSDMKDLCIKVKEQVDLFVGEAPQFDDMTMLAVKYNGVQENPNVYFEKATINDVSAVTEFIEAELERNDWQMKTIMQINVAIDELFSNIVRYGYPEGPGPVKVELMLNDDEVSIRFTDEGIPYNPLDNKTPDVSLSAEKRDIGGLGIFIVKKTMDDVHYEYKNFRNVLTITKKKLAE